jgi:spore coat protein U-like protein
VVIILAVTFPALATPPSTDYATSETFTSTMDAEDPGTYHISLLGGLDFGTCAVNQTVPSQNPLHISNDGTETFAVYVSADEVPSLMGAHYLEFSDYPGQDQVRWTLTQSPNTGTDIAINESAAASLGTVNPGDCMTLYSTVQVGTGLTHPGQYTWSATVYAVPAP